MTNTLPEKTNCGECVFFEPRDSYDHTPSMMRDGSCRLELPPYFPDFDRAVDESDGCSLGQKAPNYDPYGRNVPFEPVPEVAIKMDGIVAR